MKIKTANFRQRVKHLFTGYDFVDRSFSNQPFPTVEEPFPTAWQRNMALKQPTPEQNSAYFSCTTMSSNSVGNLPPVLKKKNGDFWKPVYGKQYQWVLDLLANPNRYQYTIDFFTRWVISLQRTGNTYVLKDRGIGGKVESMYIMEPATTQVKVADDGSVFYQFNSSKLAGLQQTITVPSSEVIHHRINCLFHDLCGLSPVFAAAIHAYHSLEIENTSYDFYRNLAQPSGILIAPEAIDMEEAKRIKAEFEQNRAKRHGSVVVMGDGMQYTPINMSAHDQQLIQLMDFNAKAICACFHIPPYKILGNAPTYSNVEALNLEYYNNALQFIVNGIEHHLTNGLELKEHFTEDLWIELDKNELLQMDRNTRGNFYNNAIKGGWMTPNEARTAEDLKPLEGGDTVYMQQQNYSMQALYERDQTNPLVVPPTPTVAPPSPEEEQADEEDIDSSDVDSSTENDNNNEKSFFDFLTTIKKGFE